MTLFSAATFHFRSKKWSFPPGRCGGGGGVKSCPSIHKNENQLAVVSSPLPLKDVVVVNTDPVNDDEIKPTMRNVIKTTATKEPIIIQDYKKPCGEMTMKEYSAIQDPLPGTTKALKMEDALDHRLNYWIGTLTETNKGANIIHNVDIKHHYDNVAAIDDDDDDDKDDDDDDDDDDTSQTSISTSYSSMDDLAERMNGTMISYSNHSTGTITSSTGGNHLTEAAGSIRTALHQAQRHAMEARKHYQGYATVALLRYQYRDEYGAIMAMRDCKEWQRKCWSIDNAIGAMKQLSRQQTRGTTNGGDLSNLGGGVDVMQTVISDTQEVTWSDNYLLDELKILQKKAASSAVVDFMNCTAAEYTNYHHEYMMEIQATIKAAMNQVKHTLSMTEKAMRGYATTANLRQYYGDRGGALHSMRGFKSCQDKWIRLKNIIAQLNVLFHDARHSYFTGKDIEAILMDSGKFLEVENAWPDCALLVELNSEDLQKFAMVN